MTTVTSRDIKRAVKRLGDHVRRTPVDAAPALARELGSRSVHLKLECLQHTGSFKLRGATNKILALGDAASRGVVAASSGNHGAAVARAASNLDVSATVFVPSYASEAKVAQIRAYGAAVEVRGDDSLVTEGEARAFAAAEDRAYVSPYNDVDVVAGQGTVAVEFLEQVPELDVIFVAVGGGGLIGGVAAHLHGARPDVSVIGALPTASPHMAESVAAGEIIDRPTLATLSDGTAGGIEEDAVTFPLCRDLVANWVLVDEDAIAEAMRFCMERQHLLIEGSAGVAIAAARQSTELCRDRHVGIVVCGGNVSLDTLRSVLGMG